ncbi:Reverse transcriptase [Phytophthora palmivora]|uniref:Reverse transcriptase n=1 Tax=Phytophthora palmivora TaxID=4796 RepID=A0A2P4YPW3_9STRA|nr:Reverse transcriptase [Phytophthora palmivora]
MSEGEAFGPCHGLLGVGVDFVFGRPANDKGNTSILVFVFRLSKMMHFTSVRDKFTGKQVAQLFIDSEFHCHGLSENSL